MWWVRTVAVCAQAVSRHLASRGSPVGIRGHALGCGGHSCSPLSCLSSVLSVWFRTVTREPLSWMRRGKRSSRCKSSRINWLRAFTICMVLNRMSKELLMEEYSGSSALSEPLDAGLAAAMPWCGLSRAQLTSLPHMWSPQTCLSTAILCQALLTRCYLWTSH